MELSREYLRIYLSYRNVMVLKIEVQEPGIRETMNHASIFSTSVDVGYPIFEYVKWWKFEIRTQSLRKKLFFIKNKLAIPFLLDKLTRGKWVNIFPGASWWCRPLASESGGGEAGLGQSAANTDPSSNIGRPLYMGVDGSGAEAEDSRGHGGSKDDYRTCTICGRDPSLTEYCQMASVAVMDWYQYNTCIMNVLHEFNFNVTRIWGQFCPCVFPFFLICWSWYFVCIHVTW